MAVLAQARWRHPTRPQSACRSHAASQRLSPLRLTALVGQAFDDGGLERGDALFQELILLARLLRHGLDRLELLALHDFEIAQDPLGLSADHGFDLLSLIHI